MDDPNFNPDARPSEQAPELDSEPLKLSAGEPPAGQAPVWESAPLEVRTADDPADVESRRRSFLHNLFLLLSLTLAAFILTAWILVRVDAPFGAFSTGPQEVVQAQLLALDRGQLRPAYDMFSSRYRGQVSFEVWHELIVTHWRMFHGEVLRSEEPAKSGPGVSLEIYLRGADDKDYRARFLLIRTDGRWWIDDVHWAVEPDRGEFSRT
ncbi:MAG: hypothetical protein LAO19_03125 [Acidobacteriia bacterium]|nr:hypothetical protein [Terriglobia bacterium]